MKVHRIRAARRHPGRDVWRPDAHPRGLREGTRRPTPIRDHQPGLGCRQEHMGAVNLRKIAVQQCMPTGCVRPSLRHSHRSTGAQIACLVEQREPAPSSFDETHHQPQTATYGTLNLVECIARRDMGTHARGAQCSLYNQSLRYESILVDSVFSRSREIPCLPLLE